MSKRQKKKIAHKNNKNILQNNLGVVDEKTLTLAIVKAYQIIESEKRLKEEKLDEQKKISKKANNEKWYINLLFMLNVLFFPWKINERFAINNKIYDSILVLFVSFILEFVGFVMWIIGFCMIINGLIMLYQGNGLDKFMGMLGLEALLIMFGSLFTLAGKEFSKVSESDRIYAYSACIIALVSCIATILPLIK